MALDDKTRFRITTWPSDPLPLPIGGFVEPRELVDDAGDPVGNVKHPHPDRNFEFGEVYLELVELDLEDDAAIESFYGMYGALGMYDEYTWRPPRGEGERDEGIFGFPGLYDFDEAVAPNLVRLRRKLKLGPTQESLSEFIWGAHCIKDMTTAWRIENGQLSADDAVWVADCYDNPMSSVPENYYADSVWVLTTGMISGLRPFGPTVHVFTEEEQLKGPGYGGAHPVQRGAEMPLYCVLCLELFNHMTEDAEYRACANETCGRLFVRQSGRANHGQHRTKGVKYCSAECAKSQAQRAYRRRKSAES